MKQVRPHVPKVASTSVTGVQYRCRELASVPQKHSVLRAATAERSELESDGKCLCLCNGRLPKPPIDSYRMKIWEAAVEFRPWMMEAAHDFIRGSRLLSENNLGRVSMVNVGIGLEILFKSFNATVDGPSGGIGEQYQTSDRRHNLLELFDAIPNEILERLDFQNYRDYFEGDAGELFVRARYPYERDGIDEGGTAIIEVAEEMFDRVMREYKDGGCTDPWIVAYPTP